jgi:hypothetical protein
MQGFWELQSKQADGGGPLLALDETLSFVFNFSPDAVRGHFRTLPHASFHTHRTCRCVQQVYSTIAAGCR